VCPNDKAPDEQEPSFPRDAAPGYVRLTGRRNWRIDDFYLIRHPLGGMRDPPPQVHYIHYMGRRLCRSFPNETGDRYPKDVCDTAQLGEIGCAFAVFSTTRGLRTVIQ